MVGMAVIHRWPAPPMLTRRSGSTSTSLPPSCWHSAASAGALRSATTTGNFNSVRSTRPLPGSPGTAAATTCASAIVRAFRRKRCGTAGEGRPGGQAAPDSQAAASVRQSVKRTADVHDWRMTLYALTRSSERLFKAYRATREKLQVYPRFCREQLVAVP